MQVYAGGVRLLRGEALLQETEAPAGRTVARACVAPGGDEVLALLDDGYAWLLRLADDGDSLVECSVNPSVPPLIAASLYVDRAGLFTRAGRADEGGDGGDGSGGGGSGGRGGGGGAELYAGFGPDLETDDLLLYAPPLPTLIDETPLGMDAAVSEEEVSDSAGSPQHLEGRRVLCAGCTAAGDPSRTPTSCRAPLLARGGVTTTPACATTLRVRIRDSNGQPRPLSLASHTHTGGTGQALPRHTHCTDPPQQPRAGQFS